MANTTGRKPHKAVAHTDSPSSYALLLSGCTNYAFYIFYARRNRRNSPSMARFLLALPSMARFLLALPSMAGHFCVSMHNSTATKQLRYALSRESVCATALRGLRPLGCGFIYFVRDISAGFRGAHTLVRAHSGVT